MAENSRSLLAQAMRDASSEAHLYSSLRNYIIGRLELPEDTKENNLYYLVLYSVRLKMPNEDVATLESRLATVDCHQTSYIVSKKTLLMMEIEREYGASITADAACEVSSVEEYAKALWRSKNEKQ